MREDRAYLDQLQQQLASRGFETRTHLAMGDPATELARVAAAQNVDLIAMSTHGHQFVKDLLYGSVANEVRHITRVPVLLVRGVAELDRETQERRARRSSRETPQL